MRSQRRPGTAQPHAAHGPWFHWPQDAFAAARAQWRDRGPFPAGVSGQWCPARCGVAARIGAAARRCGRRPPARIFAAAVARRSRRPGRQPQSCPAAQAGISGGQRRHSATAPLVCPVAQAPSRWGIWPGKQRRRAQRPRCGEGCHRPPPLVRAVAQACHRGRWREKPRWPQNRHREKGHRSSSAPPPVVAAGHLGPQVVQWQRQTRPRRTEGPQTWPCAVLVPPPGPQAPAAVGETTLEAPHPAA